MTIDLSRRAGGLLQTVKNKPRDKYDQDAKRKSTPEHSAAKKRTNEEDDVNRSPASSDSGLTPQEPRSSAQLSQSQTAAVDLESPTRPVHTSSPSRERAIKPFRRSTRGAPYPDGGTDLQKSSSEPSSGEKRKRNARSALSEDDLCEAMIFSQQSQRPRKTYASSSQRMRNPPINIHGSSSLKASEQKRSLRTAKNGFVTPYDNGPPKMPEKPAFQLPKGLNDISAEDRVHMRSQPDQAPKAPLLTLATLSRHNAFAVDNSSGTSSPLSTARGSSIIIDLDSDYASCPACKRQVSRELLEEFTGSNHMGWREKMRFCEEHRRNTAEEIWGERNYPNINWTRLESRLRKFKADIGALLEGQMTSFYRRELEEKVATGENRNAFRNPDKAGQEVIVPGYYGPKGAQKIQEHIIKAFSKQIREVATKDKLIPATGATGYAQAVLVPEVALMLIKEDLGVDEERAREVMEESAEVGDLLNPQEEEKALYGNENDNENENEN